MSPAVEKTSLGTEEVPEIERYALATEERAVGTTDHFQTTT